MSIGKPPTPSSCTANCQARDLRFEPITVAGGSTGCGCAPDGSPSLGGKASALSGGSLSSESGCLKVQLSEFEIASAFGMSAPKSSALNERVLTMDRSRRMALVAWSVRKTPSVRLLGLPSLSI